MIVFMKHLSLKSDKKVKITYIKKSWESFFCTQVHIFS